MKKLDIFKTALSVAVSSGTFRIVREVVANNVAVDTRWQKLTVIAATLGVSYYVADTVCDHIEALVDEHIDLVQKVSQSAKQAAKEAASKAIVAVEPLIEDD